MLDPREVDARELHSGFGRRLGTDQSIARYFTSPDAWKSRASFDASMRIILLSCATLRFWFYNKRGAPQ